MQRPDYELQLKQAFERHLDLIFSKSPYWEIERKGFATNGMGDLIWRTALFAIATGDIELLLACINLLNQYKRWPDWCEPGRKERKRLKGLGFRGFRGQRSMTRDPYIMTFSAIYLSKEGPSSFWLKELRIPFWMNRPMVWAWVKSLRAWDKKRNPWKPIFQFLAMRNMDFREWTNPRREIWKRKKEEAKKADQRFREWWFDALQKNLGYPGFSRHLHGWMAYTAGAEKVQHRLLKGVQHWNYGLMLLCEKPTLYLARDFIENWPRREGYHWQADTYNKSKAEIPEDQLCLEKQVLDYLWDEWKETRAKEKRLKKIADEIDLENFNVN